MMQHETKENGPTVLIYWHDMWIPHSRFLVDELQGSPSAARVALCGPAVRRNAASVFLIEGASRQGLSELSGEYKTKSYVWRETICTLREWKRIITSERPDIMVVCDEALSLNVLFAGIANRLYGNAVVLFYGFENIIQKPSWSELSKRPTFSGFRKFLRETIRAVVIDRMFMPVRRRLIHGGLVSYDECSSIIHAYNWKPRMINQWWPVNTRVFTRDGPRADLGIRSDFVVGFVGRFVAEKGITDLLGAVAALDRSVSLVLVGDGPDKQSILSKISELGIVDRCRVLPPQNSEGLAACYRALDLVILPSKPTRTWKEQYGRALVEARLCGARIAGSNVGAIPVVVGDAEMIFPPGDVQAIARTIRKAQSRITNAGWSGTSPTPQQFFSAWLRLANECRPL